MKSLLKKILTVLAIIGVVSITTGFINSQNTFAEFSGRTGADCPSYLGLTSWDCGVNINSEETLKTGIWTIAANVATDIAVIAAYLVLGYVIYGGYLYTLSGGDANKVASGKKTLTQAFIGLAIVMSANLILGTIRIILVQNGNLASCNIETGEGCIEPNVLVENLINWFIAIAGLVSTIFLIYGGITYITSSGDATKLQKAKNTILYSLIGLAIVALATVITAFVSSAIRDANQTQTSLLNDNYISKEIYETKIN